MLIKTNNERNKTIEIEYIKLYDWINKKFGIPIFQRLYVWKKDTAEPLMNDLLTIIHESNKDLYYLDFIYYEEDGKIKLADGQQRLITLNILIQVINDVIDSEDLPISKLDLFDITYDIADFNAKYQTSFFSYPTAPFKEVYLFYRDEFIIPNKNHITKIIYAIKNNICVYMKKCLTSDDAFEIFSNINNGGKGLKKDEVMKTAINQYSEVYGVPISYTNKSLTDIITSYYKYKTNDTAGNFSNLSIMTFIKDYITKDKTSFVNFVDTYKSLKNLDKNPFYSIFNFIGRTSLIDVLNILALEGIDITANTEYIEKVIIPLCLVSINMSLTGFSPTNMRYLISDIIVMIKEGKEVDDISLFIGKYIDDNGDSIKIPLSTYQSLLNSKDTKEGIKKSIIIIDIIYRNVSSTINMNKINLEHIYPKSPKVDWSLKGWPANKDDQKPLIGSIGNYFILCESVNKTIKNKYITDKVHEYNKIIPKDKGLKTAMNTVDFVRFESDKGTYIKERAYKIAEMVKNNLPYGGKLIK